MIKLRKYQEKAVKKIRDFFAKGGYHCLLQAPTGSGKTVIFSYIAQAVAVKKKRVLILTDRIELLQQTGGALKEFGVEAFNIRAGVKYYNSNFTCYVAMIQTLRRRLKDDYWLNFIKSIDLIIIDEAHKQDFNILLESDLVEKKHIIGFTATPKRSGKMRQLGLDYQTIITTVTVRWLIKKGFLVNDDTYSIEGANLDGVEIDSKTGDYKSSSAFVKFNNSKIYAGLIDNYKELIPDTKTMVFCTNIEHVIITTQKFNEAGIKAKYIVSNVIKPKGDTESQRFKDQSRLHDLYTNTFEEMSGSRETVFKQHKNGEFPVLINAGIATTGYDDKSLQTIILNRATLSTVLFLQMIGRGSRIFPGKSHFNILDFGGNIKRHGNYTDDREFGLWHETTTGEGLPPTKRCGFEASGEPINGADLVLNGCNRMILASYKICPFCDFKYPEKEVKEVVLRLTKNSKSIKEMTSTELHDYWKAKKHKSAWLWRQLWYKGKEHSIRKFAEKYDWKPKTIQTAIKFCKEKIK